MVIIRALGLPTCCIHKFVHQTNRVFQASKSFGTFLRKKASPSSPAQPGGEIFPRFVEKVKMPAQSSMFNLNLHPSPCCLRLKNNQKQLMIRNTQLHPHHPPNKKKLRTWSPSTCSTIARIPTSTKSSRKPREPMRNLHF